MHEWITSIQPPGLMKTKLVHYQKHHEGHQHIKAIHDVVCHSTIFRCHMNSSVVLAPSIQIATGQS